MVSLEFTKSFESCVSDFLELCDVSRLVGRIETPKLAEACLYSVLSPGKRLRPALVFASADIVGVARPLVADWALAIEVLHASSLVHDDLPALDNDTLRRGSLTTHAKFGEAQAILTGDALIALAFEAITSSQQTPDGVKIALMKLLARSACDLCEGQVLDLETFDSGDSGRSVNSCCAENVQGVADPEHVMRLLSRHEKKTGSLICASLVGAVYYRDLTQDSSEFSALKRYGDSLGLLFQITDDILDVTSSVTAMGKHPQTDVRAGRVTYVTAFGVKGAKERAVGVYREAISSLVPFGEKAWFLEELARFILERNK